MEDDDVDDDMEFDDGMEWYCMLFVTVEMGENIVGHTDCKLEECRRTVKEFVGDLMLQCSPELGCCTMDDAEYWYRFDFAVQICWKL
jgi:hypothetical protein